MIAFDINVEQINKNLKSIDNNIKKFNEDLQHLNSNLTNIDSCWQDDRTNGFIKHVNSDNGKVLTQIESLKQTINISQTFTDNLKQYISASINLTTKTIKYNSDRVEDAITSLYNAYIQLGYAIEKINQVSLTSSFVYYNKFNDIKSNVNRIRNDIDSLKTSLNSLNSNIKTSYQTMRDNSSKANPYIIGDSDILFYKYQVETPNI